ncbi:MAG: NUDIX hydrolase [Paracoccaceae bacterium]
MVPVKKVASRTGKRTQYAALCYRMRKGNRLEILLVTSRGKGHWIPPKGWPMKGQKPHDAAAIEAWEEAGVKGQVHDSALGRFKYGRMAGKSRATEAYVFPLEVKKLAKSFKEKGQRRVKWFKAKKAASLVREPKLRKMIRQFDPASL